MTDQKMLEILDEMIAEIIKEHRYEADESVRERVTALRKAHYYLSHMGENRTTYVIDSVKTLEDLGK